METQPWRIKRTINGVTKNYQC